MVLRPTNWPIPWSICTIISPEFKAEISEIKFVLFLRRFGDLIKRSPRISCSAIIAKSSATKPCSIMITAANMRSRGVALTVCKDFTTSIFFNPCSSRTCSKRLRDPSLQHAKSTFLPAARKDAI